MAKFDDVFEDTQALFDTHLKQIDNLNEVNIKILANNRLKQIGKVVKANDLLKHMTDEDIVILINERIFEQLEVEQKKMTVEELVAEIYFDAEADKVKIVKPDINTFSLLLSKYGYDKYERLKLSINALMAQEAEEEIQEA